MKAAAGAEGEGEKPLGGWRCRQGAARVQGTRTQGLYLGREPERKEPPHGVPAGPPTLEEQP